MENHSENSLHEIYAELLVLAKQIHANGFCGATNLDLSSSQVYALEVLAESSEISMGILAENLGLNLSTVTKIIDTLERKKLVTRRPSKRDLRIMEIKITRSGRDLVRQSKANFLVHLEKSLSAISLTDRKTFSRCLGVLVDILKSWETQAEKHNRRQIRDPERMNIVYREKYDQH